MSDSDEENHSTASSQRSVSSSDHSSDSSDDANISNDVEEEVEEDEVEEEEKRARKRKRERERKGAQRGPRKNISKGEEVSDGALNPAYPAQEQEVQSIPCFVCSCPRHTVAAVSQCSESRWRTRSVVACFLPAS
jgi:hypothetical protein